MNIDIMMNEQKKVTVNIKGRYYEKGFHEVTPYVAIKLLKVMIAEEQASRLTIKEYLYNIIDSFDIGETSVINTLGREIKDFRVRLSTASQEKQAKFKTKIIDGQLIATRVL